MAFARVMQSQDDPQGRGSWVDLPLEIRREILDLVCQDHKKRRPLASRDEPGRDRLATFATVSSEWQFYFEDINFRHLSIDPKSLGDFRRITSGKNARRARIVRHILFLVVLPEYACPSCRKLETWFEVYRNNKIFTCAMEEILCILSTWAPRDRSGGVTFELGIKSLSDYKHYYDDITMHRDYPLRSWDRSEEWQDMADMAMYHSRKFTYCGPDSRPWHQQSLRAAERRPQTFLAATRYLGSLLQFQGLKNKHLPRVACISHFLMRHQFKRQMSPLTLSQLVRQSLINMTTFTLERWCRITTEEERGYLQEFREYTLASLPDSLESFHYFAENLTRSRGSPPADTNPISALELAQTHGHRWKEISVVEPCSAETRLAAKQSVLIHPLNTGLFPAHGLKLERICFRSHTLHHDTSSDLIDRLFLDMARVAASLPTLRSLEIFNLHKDVHGCQIPSCLFRYSVEFDRAMLLWESAWQLTRDTQTSGFEFSAQVQSAWDMASTAHGGHGITVLVNEPKNETVNEAGARMYYWSKGVRRLAESFRVDAIHPFTRALMTLQCDRMWNRWSSDLV